MYPCQKLSPRNQSRIQYPQFSLNYLFLDFHRSSSTHLLRFFSYLDLVFFFCFFFLILFRVYIKTLSWILFGIIILNYIIMISWIIKLNLFYVWECDKEYSLVERVVNLRTAVQKYLQVDGFASDISSLFTKSNFILSIRTSNYN